MNPVASNRRITRKNFALTFPRCPVDKTDMLQHLKSLFYDTDIVYLLVAQEHHQDGGLHLHCFLQLKMPINLKNMKKFDLLIDTVNYHPEIEECKSIKDWINYCKKEGNWCDWGSNPLTTSKLNKKELNEKLINSDLNELIDNGTISLKELPRIIQAKEAYKLLQKKQRRRELKVKWYYGATGTGKTRKALDEAGDDYWISGENLKWFDGYKGQETVVLDDLRADSCAWGFLLRLLDIYPLSVPIKGGFSDWKPKTVIITAPCIPEEMFVNHASGQTWDKIDQLKRRVNEYRNFDEEVYNPSTEVEKFEII